MDRKIDKTKLKSALTGRHIDRKINKTKTVIYINRQSHSEKDRQDKDKSTSYKHKKYQGELRIETSLL